jgi:arylsulfatase A-like enzyme
MERKQKGRLLMNVIFILSDSLNRHFLSIYGNTWVKTPNIERLAKRSVIFEQHYTGSAPCMPARRDIWTGCIEFPWRGWGPREHFDEHIALLCRTKGIPTQMFTDHYHYWEIGGTGYHTEFDGCEMIRGHECDYWACEPCLRDRNKLSFHGQRNHFQQYIMNSSRFKTEEDFPSPKTLSLAAEWLDRNAKYTPFFLAIECFDPHEPFHVPEPYYTMYGQPVEGETYWPSYGRADRYSPEIIERIRQLYAGKVTMFDRWLGQVLDRIDRYNLWDNTVIIFTADHGHYLGEHGLVGKPYANPWNTLFHIPLLIHFPGAPEGIRTSALSTAVDIFATIADALELSLRKMCHGHSLLPVVKGECKSVRDSVMMGYWGRSVAFTDGQYKLHQAPNSENQPLYKYGVEISRMRALRSLPEGVEIGRFISHAPNALVLRIPCREEEVRREVPSEPLQTQLFDIQADPHETRNLADSRQDIRREMQRKLVNYMKEIKVPEEQYKRLGLTEFC